MGLRLTVLGSGTAYPSAARAATAFALHAGERTFLVDGGAGTLLRCAQAGIDARALAGGLYTHHHPDHCAELASLLFGFRMPPARTAPYPILAGAGFARVLQGLDLAWGRWVARPEGSALVELPLEASAELDFGPLRVRAAPAAHGAGALHLRVEFEGVAVVFSGDTGPSEALAELARDADLLVCECASTEAAPLPGHLRASDVADLVCAARPREVWLHHLYPEVDPREALASVAASGAPTRLAADGDRWPTPTRS